MKNLHLISIRLPAEFVEIIDEMVLDGRLASRSEGIRLALRDFYKAHYEIKQQSVEFQFPEVGEIKSNLIIYEDEQ